jgi:hypothetical protein
VTDFSFFSFFEQRARDGATHCDRGKQKAKKALEKRMKTLPKPIP